MATKTEKVPVLKFKHKLDDLVWVMRKNVPMVGKIVSRTLREGKPYSNIEYQVDFKFNEIGTKYPDWENYSHHTTLHPSKQAVIDSLTAE